MEKKALQNMRTFPKFETYNKIVLIPNPAIIFFLIMENGILNRFNFRLFKFFVVNACTVMNTRLENLNCRRFDS